ncbi:hypothetical protein WDJ51_04825 [Rathayibacter sp. YIM 133350]|uniref:hypothetical protein n=1 Tax=Rathayibacter sp. YIM 133350 TaxID=3131992 RepID=UPI00307F3B27
MSLLTTVLAEGTEPAVPTFVFGLVALGVFAVLGFITFSYRDVANRHSAKADAYAAAHSGSAEHGGHGGH